MEHINKWITLAIEQLANVWLMQSFTVPLQSNGSQHMSEFSYLSISGKVRSFKSQSYHCYTKQ